MKENQNSHPFRELWDNALKNEKEKLYCQFYQPGNDPTLWSLEKSTLLLKAEDSTTIKMWKTENPQPQFTRDQFIVALAKRVEVLEAALAEIGGAK